jgi:hypothetical protein
VVGLLRGSVAFDRSPGDLSLEDIDTLYVPEREEGSPDGC